MEELLMKAKCADCVHLISDSFRNRLIYTCEKGRFATPSYQTTWFSWSGIKRPNKTVARAQSDCPFASFKKTK